MLAATSSAFPQEETWLQQARVALAKGDFNTARAAATEALRQNAASAEAEVILGLVDTAGEQLLSAESHFARAITLQPGNYRAHTYLGSTYLRQQKFVEAQRSFVRVLQLNPGNTVAQYNLGVIAVLQQKPAVALPYFSAVHQANPRDTAALVALLECQLDLKQGTAAHASAQKLDKLLPADSPILLQVGTTLASRGAYAAALPLLRRSAAANPALLDAGYNLGLALLHTGALEEAEAVVRRLLSQAPKAEAYNLLGSVMEKRGDAKGAVQAFAEAARLAPANEDYRIDYGSALINADALEEAIAVFSRAVTDLPQSTRLRLGLGSALYLSGKYDQAAGAMLECIRRAPGFAPAYDLLGKMFDSAPESQAQILETFQMYLRDGNQDAVAHAHYGAMLYAKAESDGAGRFLEAKQHLRRALILNPRLAQAHVQLGIILQAEGNMPAAVASFQRGVALAPTYAAAHYRLASAYRKIGNQARAESELEVFRNLKKKEKEQEKEALLKGVASAEP